MSSRLAERLRGKRIGLAMSSGFFGFFHHAGLLIALEETGLLPAKLTGTSAGALVAAMYASGLDGPAIRRELLGIRRGDFWDMQIPFSSLGFGLLAGQRFSAKLAETLLVHRFEDCRALLAVGVYCLDDGRVRHISSGPLVPAVYASCAIPYLFMPAEIEGRRYWDGAFGEKTPLVPFLDQPKMDVVIVSYMSPRRSGHGQRKGGISSFLPPLASLAAYPPDEERRERDLASLALLRKAGTEVIVMAPARVWLGPFSLPKAEAAIEQGLAGARRILESTDDSLLGSPDLS